MTSCGGASLVRAYWALRLTSLVTFSYGLLEAYADFPRISMFVVWPINLPGLHLRSDTGKAALPLVENRLRDLRGERGWSQAELAARLGVSRQTVNALEVGKYDPSLPLAFKLARLFGRSTEHIFTDIAS